MRYAMMKICGVVMFACLGVSTVSFAADTVSSNAPKPKAAPAKAPDAKPKGFVTVVCSPTCDDVVVAGRSLGPSPLVRVEVPAGSQKVLLKRKSQADKTMVVDVTAGELVTLKVQLPMQKAPSDKPPPEIAAEIAARTLESKGYLTVVCEPGCDEIIVDDTRKLGRAPLADIEIAAGKHQIKLKLKGAAEKVVNVLIVAGQTTAFRASMADDGGASKVEADEASVRASLEPKVWGGKATLDEMRMLKAVCSHQADRPCRDRVNAMIQALALKPAAQP